LRGISLRLLTLCLLLLFLCLFRCRYRCRRGRLRLWGRRGGRLVVVGDGGGAEARSERLDCVCGGGRGSSMSGLGTAV